MFRFIGTLLRTIAKNSPHRTVYELFQVFCSYVPILSSTMNYIEKEKDRNEIRIYTRVRGFFVLGTWGDILNKRLNLHKQFVCEG